MTATPAAARAERGEPLLARARAAAGERHVQALAGLTLLGGGLRFATLGRQSLWFDETLVAHLMPRSFGGMLRGLATQESTPPLFYSLTWLWTRLFGTGEASMRTVSALAGTATIPVVYLVANRLVSRRAGLVAAALAACSPYLVWYSQEARAYALLCLLSGISILLVLRAREHPTHGRTIAWAVVAALALATHYFAIFIVAPELVWLLMGRSRRVVLAAAGVTVVGAALLPLAIKQRASGYTQWVATRPFRVRATETVQDFTVGNISSGTLRHALFVPGGLMLVSALVLLWRRASERERRGALVAGALAAAAIGLAILVAIAGLDYVYHRNLIEAWIPLAIVVAAGLGAQRAGRVGLALAGAFCVLGVATTIAIDATPRLQRADWRDIAPRVTAPSSPRVLVVSPFALPIAWYSKRVAVLPPGGVRTRSFLVVYSKSREPPAALAGFARAWHGEIDRVPVARYESPTPRLVRRGPLQHAVARLAEVPTALVTHN